MIALGVLLALAPGASAQSRDTLFVLPIDAHRLTAASSGLVADVAERLLVELRRGGPRLTVQDVSMQVLQNAGIPRESIRVENLRNLGGWWKRVPSLAATGNRPNTLLVELTPVRDVAGLIRARYVVMSGAGVAVVEDSLQITSNEASALANQVADRLVMRLTRDIRIAVTDFRVAGADSSQEYGHAVARMLGTRLSASPRLLLLEYSSSDTAIQTQFQLARRPGVVDPLTAVERGRVLLANYLVMGDIWRLGKALRVDVRCVSVESRAVIVSRGVTIEPIEVKAVDAQLAILASDMLGAIESDFTQQANRPRFIAVAGIEPNPNSRENRALTSSLVRSLRRKVAKVQHDRLKVREAFDETVWSARVPRWSMSAMLDADVLVQIRMDRLQRDVPVIDVTFFDADRPNATRSLPFSTSIDSLDSALNQIVRELFVEQSLPLREEEREKAQADRYRGPESAFVMDVAYGFSNRMNSDPFLEAGQGLVLRVAPALMIWSEPYVTLEPIALRLDLFGMKNATVGSGRRTVFGFDVFATVVYHWRTRRAVSPFAGATFSPLSGVVRHVRSETQLDARPAAGAMLGVEITLGSGRRVRCRLEMQSTFTPIQDWILDREHFLGGNIGGAYFTVGTSR